MEKIFQLAVDVSLFINMQLSCKHDSDVISTCSRVIPAIGIPKYVSHLYNALLESIAIVHM